MVFSFQLKEREFKMVFNMFRGLSRLLSRKSAKTLPPVVGFKSAEQPIEPVFIDRQSLILKGVNGGILVEWWNGSATIHTAAVSANELRQVLRQGYPLSSFAMSTRVTYNTGKAATVVGLVDVLVMDQVLSRSGNTVYLVDGVTLF